METEFPVDYTGQYNFFRPKDLYNKNTRLALEFHEFDDANPKYWELIENDIFDAIAEGRTSDSIGQLIEYGRRNKGWVISHNHDTYYGRKFMEKYPQFRGYFKEKPLKQN